MTRTIIMTARTARTAIMIPAIAPGGRPLPLLESSIPLSASESPEESPDDPEEPSRNPPNWS